jgi:hypothetical protein
MNFDTRKRNLYYHFSLWESVRFVSLLDLHRKWRRVGEPVESAPFRLASIRLTTSQFGNKGMWKKQMGSPNWSEPVMELKRDQHLFPAILQIKARRNGNDGIEFPGYRFSVDEDKCVHAMPPSSVFWTYTMQISAGRRLSWVNFRSFCSLSKQATIHYV